MMPPPAPPPPMPLDVRRARRLVTDAAARAAQHDRALFYRMQVAWDILRADHAARTTTPRRPSPPLGAPVVTLRPARTIPNRHAVPRPAGSGDAA